MTALSAPSAHAAATLTGVWRLVEINSVPMQETPPYGQINRKEIYTADGELLVCAPDVDSSHAQSLGHCEIKDGVRVFTAPTGEQSASLIHWIDSDHFSLEFSPGECWYYARVLGDNAREQQWEPRSVVVIRMNEEGIGPTLRDFPYDLSDDSAMPWAKRIFGAWETIRVGGRGVSGPDTPPYGMPNDRLLIAADGTLRYVHANGEAEPGSAPMPFKVEGNQLMLLEADARLHFWFNRWGQLVLEDAGQQTIFKRISLDAAHAPAGPFVVVLLSSEREQPSVKSGKIIEIKKSVAAAVSQPFPSAAVPATAARRVARAQPTFRTPFNGGSMPSDLALADDAVALRPENPVYHQAGKKNLGSAPTILRTNADEKFSTIRADAIDADLNVPFGWHVADNGDRVMVFDADHFIEISLEKKPAKPGSEAMLQAILDAQRAVQTDLRAQLMDKGDGGHLLIMSNFTEREVVKPRAYFTCALGESRDLILGRIDSNQPDQIRALNLSEALTRHLKPSS